MDNLYKKLIEYSDSDYYGFHMPGHKRRDLFAEKENIQGIPYALDITEIEGFDDLHHPKGILEVAQKRAAQLYSADETCYLINGSTSGILSAVLGCTKKGGKILMARNCHKSVYHAVYLNELRATYIYPDFYEKMELNGPISAIEVRRVLEQDSEIQAIVITSPTYDGVVSDVHAIAEVAHEYSIPLIVDEAHGAHFGFHNIFPDNANKKGADIVIHSLHKTMPSLTQTALLHMNGELVNRKKIRKNLDMIQTSSPSYVLMASIDACMELMLKHKETLFKEYVQRLEETRSKLRKMKYLQVWSTENFDQSKFIISVTETGLTSKELYEILLEKYHLQMEMSAGSYVLAMTSIADSKEGMERFAEALLEIDKNYSYKSKEKHQEKSFNWKLPKLEQRFSSSQAEAKKEEQSADQTTLLRWEQSIGRTALEYTYIYPPGIPLIVPGEIITNEVVALLGQYRAIGFSIEGITKEGYVEVLPNG